VVDTQLPELPPVQSVVKVNINLTPEELLVILLLLVDMFLLLDGTVHFLLLVVITILFLVNPIVVYLRTGVQQVNTQVLDGQYVNHVLKVNTQIWVLILASIVALVVMELLLVQLHVLLPLLENIRAHIIVLCLLLS
jgi:hypothetical protein